MEKYLITGGNKLYGKVDIESAKNSVLPLLVASILTDDEVVIKNCPKILDVFSMCNILSHLGASVSFKGKDIHVNCSNISSFTLPKELTEKLRASVFTLGALISRFKKAKLSYPGGCNIGKRPIDIHLDCLRAMGVKIKEQDCFVECSANKIMGVKYTLDYPSVGATENAILTAVLGEGKTEIRNCAREPEIIDLANMLNLMGAKVFGAGTSTIFIDGVKKLRGVTYTPIPDRIETGTFMLAVAITGGELQLNNCNLKNILTLSNKLCQNTCKIYQNNGIMYLNSGGSLKSLNITTGPYPEFPTDLQAPASTLACVCEGNSVINERVFENRFGHFEELSKMGANVLVKGSTAYVKGVKELNGTFVKAKDLRCGASLVLAGLVAKGQTVVDGAYHVKRGYCDFDKKLRELGADITLIDE